jgi:hypothetical protein
VRGHPSYSSLPLRERTKVRGAVKFFPSLSTSQERVRVRGFLIFSFHPFSPFASPLSTSRERARVRGALFKSFHLPSSLSTPRERVRVRGNPSYSSLHLRERTKPRGAVKSFPT